MEPSATFSLDGLRAGVRNCASPRLRKLLDRFLVKVEHRAGMPKLATILEAQDDRLRSAALQFAQPA
jgi:hypothetical protein